MACPALLRRVELWLGCVLAFTSALACATHSYEVATSAPTPIPIQGPSAYSADDKSSDDLAALCEIDPDSCAKKSQSRPEDDNISERPVVEEVSAISGPLSDAPAARSATSIFSGGSSGAPAPRTPPAVIETGKGSPGNDGEMLDIEARVNLRVDSISKAVLQIRAAVTAAGGQVVNEVIADNSSSSGASISLRVPSSGVHRFLSGLPNIGKLESRTIESKDIGREYHDAQVLLRNLEATLARYEALLAKADTVKDMVTLEAAMARVRTRLDRVKGDLRYLKDRAARSTVYIQLKSEGDSEAVEPEAHLYPGVRGALAWDFPADESTRTFAGAGFSLYFWRAFNLDADFLDNTSGDGDPGIDLFIATVGSELYSDFLGGGDRAFLNPYLGFRLGYARNLGLDELALGGSLGIDVWKTEFVTVDLNTRVYAFVGSSERGAHPVVEPNLTLRFSY